MIKKIDHIVITTSDVERCIHFYESIGFTSKNDSKRYELFAGNFKINVHIKDYELLPHAKYVQTGSADLCFELTGDIYDFKAELEAKGFTIEVGVVSRTGANGNMHSIYLRDPDGNLLEFCSYK